MKESDRYLKLVQWSEEDACYIGTCPGLMLGGVHGDNEIEVYAELCEAVEECIKIYQEDGEPLPEPTAKAYSGQFKLNVGKTLHKALSLAALQAGESLNNYCVKNLKQYAPPYNVL
jgi:predicted HicB family RNase H-like nuclease